MPNELVKPIFIASRGTTWQRTFITDGVDYGNLDAPARRYAQEVLDPCPGSGEVFTGDDNEYKVMILTPEQASHVMTQIMRQLMPPIDAAPDVVVVDPPPVIVNDDPLWQRPHAFIRPFIRPGSPPPDPILPGHLLCECGLSSGADIHSPFGPLGHHQYVRAPLGAETRRCYCGMTERGGDHEPPLGPSAA